MIAEELNQLTTQMVERPFAHIQQFSQFRLDSPATNKAFIKLYMTRLYIV